MIDKGLWYGKTILSDFVFDAGAVFVDAIGPNGATILKMQRFSRCQDAPGDNKTKDENESNAHEFQV